MVLPVDLVSADVLGDAAGLAGRDVRLADAVEEQGLAVVDVAHHGDHGRPRPEVLLALFFIVLEVLRLELSLLLLTRVDEADARPELGGEQLDHVVGERLGGRDHLTLQEEEPDDVAGGAVELGAELTRRRAPLHDHFEVGDGGVRGCVGGELRGLELFEVPSPSAGAVGRLTATSPGTAARTGRGWPTGAPGETSMLPCTSEGQNGAVAVVGRRNSNGSILKG